MNECKKEKRGGICFYNCDNIEFMKTKPDNYYDLAIVDPPYSFGKNTLRKETKPNKSNGFAIMYNGKKWNSEPPKKEYWEQLFRVSKNQIVCGGNYFTDNLPVTRGWILWDKMGDNLSVVNDELIWTSFDVQIKKFVRCHGMDKGFMNKEGKNIHPTQKPVHLYRWLLQNYAKDGWKIFDTHGGSMSIAIAADMEGFDVDITEIDIGYFQNAINRFDMYKRQLKLF